MIINSGSLEDNSEEEIVNIYAPEHQELKEGTTFEDLPDRSGKIKRTSSTDYAKMAKALGDIISRGINVSLVNINESEYSFSPNIKNNQIRFGLKGLNAVGDPVIEQIIAGRPYEGIRDFMNRCPLDKTAMVSLIKAGAFDELDSDWASKINKEPRRAIMMYYLVEKSELKKKLTLSNFSTLIQRKLIPESLDFERRVFNFNKYIKTNCKVGKDYRFDEPAQAFYEAHFDMDKINYACGVESISEKDWDKQYQCVMDGAREWIRNNEASILDELNMSIVRQNWNKYASGTISAWEMESLCFYYHDHELKEVDTIKYGISNFFSLDKNPEVEYYFKRNGKEIPIFSTFKIIGTVVGKNETRSSISLLTTSGVVNVKFTKEYFAMYNRQLSETQEDGHRKVVEKGWFNRGVRLMVTGFRRDDTFNAKTYKHTPTHQLYRITAVNGKEIKLEHERVEV